MSSSGEALVFFREWRNFKTKLSFTLVLGDAVVSGTGWITSLDAERLLLTNPASRFSMFIPLEGCSFEASDPERTTGNAELDALALEMGFRLGWDIVLPSNNRIVLAEMEEKST
jgi:hypothetical protein